MGWGGKREKAGRKKGVANLLTRELKEKIDAEALIDVLQDIALGRVAKASINERKDAAIALLKKVLPDSNRLEGDIAVSKFEPLRVSRGAQNV